MAARGSRSRSSRRSGSSRRGSTPKRTAAKRTRLYAVKTPTGWGVRKAGAKRLSSKHRTQKAAINAARRKARKSQPSSVTVQGRNRRFREERTYGRDPYPPTG